MPKEFSRTRRNIHFSFFTVLFLVCIPIIILYSLGYTIDAGTFGLSSRGGIYVSVEEPDVTIYVGDNIKETTGIFRKEVLIKNLKPKEYIVVTGSEVFWPWTKVVTVSEGEVSALYPLLVPKTLSFKNIVKADENYADVVKLFSVEPKSISAAALAKIPAASSTALAMAEGVTKGKMKIWKENNSVFASWLGSADRVPPYFCGDSIKCEDTIGVFHAGLSLGRIDFYPDREDAIILILDHEIYAMEIDGRKYRNFYPIYKGNDPDFRIVDNQIYIKDGVNFSSTEL